MPARAYLNPSELDPAPPIVDRLRRRGLVSTGIMSTVILPSGRLQRSSGEVAGVIIVALLVGLIASGLGWFAVGMF